MAQQHSTTISDDRNPVAIFNKSSLHSRSRPDHLGSGVQKPSMHVPHGAPQCGVRRPEVGRDVVARIFEGRAHASVEDGIANGWK